MKISPNIALCGHFCFFGPQQYQILTCSEKFVEEFKINSPMIKHRHMQQNLNLKQSYALRQYTKDQKIDIGDFFLIKSLWIMMLHSLLLHRPKTFEFNYLFLMVKMLYTLSIVILLYCYYLQQSVAQDTNNSVYISKEQRILMHQYTNT